MRSVQAYEWTGQNREPSYFPGRQLVNSCGTGLWRVELQGCTEEDDHLVGGRAKRIERLAWQRSDMEDYVKWCVRRVVLIAGKAPPDRHKSAVLYARSAISWAAKMTDDCPEDKQCDYTATCSYWARETAAVAAAIRPDATDEECHEKMAIASHVEKEAQFRWIMERIDANRRRKHRPKLAPKDRPMLPHTLTRHKG